MNIFIFYRCYTTSPLKYLQRTGLDWNIAIHSYIYIGSVDYNIIHSDVEYSIFGTTYQYSFYYINILFAISCPFYWFPLCRPSSGCLWGAYLDCTQGGPL